MVVKLHAAKTRARSATRVGRLEVGLQSVVSRVIEMVGPLYIKCAENSISLKEGKNSVQETRGPSCASRSEGLGFPINRSSARNELHPCLLVEVIGVVVGPGHGDLQVASRPLIDGVGSPRADHSVGVSPCCGRPVDVDRHRAAAVAQKELAEQPAWLRVPQREQRAAQMGQAGADEGPGGVEADDMGDAGGADVAIRSRQRPAEGHRLADNGSSRQARRDVLHGRDGREQSLSFQRFELR